VYRARQRVADREVAVKVVPPGADRERFEREVRTLAALDHPHVVRVFEVGESDRGPFFSMELLPGGSLAARIRRDGPLDPAEAAAVVEKAAGGVAAAHARSVLHRDLKPSNVLLDAAGEPKVADFGLAKEWLSDPDGPTADPATPSGAFLGTAAYAAPEQAAGRSAEHDARTDVYGLGAVLYQALTGDPPFGGDNTAVVLHRVLTEDPVPPRVRRRAVPPELEAVCLKCLAKRPADRYESAAAVAADLGRWRRREPTAARPPGPVGRARRWARRHAPLVRGAAVTAVVAVLVGVVAAAPWRPRRPEPDPPEPPVARINRLLRDGPVTVIPAEGLPDWENWAFGGVRLAPSPMNDGTCSFQTVGTSLVDFAVPDADRYRVTVEVRQLRGRTADEAEKERDFVALAIGRQELVAADGTRVHSFLTAGYSESVSRAEAKLTGGKGRARLEAVRVSHVPNTVAGPHQTMLGTVGSFVPHGARPGGEWRGLQADVTPAGVQFRWRPAAGAPFEDWAYLPRARIERAFGEVTDKVPAAVRARYAGMPYAWDPRAPVGLYARDGWVAVRNLVLEPLPEP
jgi:serine/threonine-protein kinase